MADHFLWPQNTDMDCENQRLCFVYIKEADSDAILEVIFKERDGFLNQGQIKEVRQLLESAAQGSLIARCDFVGYPERVLGIPKDSTMPMPVRSLRTRVAAAASSAAICATAAAENSPKYTSSTAATA